MDRETYNKLVDEHGSSLYRFCRKLSPGDADDLYQETFLRVLERRARIDESQNIKSYLFQVCMNLWRGSWRRNSRFADTSAPIESIIDASRYERSVEERVIEDEETQRLGLLIETMEEKFRVPLYLYYTSEMKVHEIAQVLGIPEGTVKSRLHKARTILKARLEEHNG